MKKNTCREAPQSMIKVGVMIMFSLFLGGLASAELIQFDNIKQYDETTQTVTIVNTFGLGKDIAEIQLKTPLIHKVGFGGVFRVAEFEVRSLSDYTDAFEEMKFYDINGKELTREFEYKVRGYEDIQVGEMGKICEKEIPSCWDIVSYHTEQKEVWTALEKSDFLDGEIKTIGIFTYVYQGDYVEWIPTMYGKKIDEWAVWTADLNTDLEVYYAFEDASGGVKDSIGNVNLTQQGHPTYSQTGIVGDAVDMDNPSACFYVEGSGSFAAGATVDLTINHWVKKAGWASDTMLLGCLNGSAPTLDIQFNDFSTPHTAFYLGSKLSSSVGYLGIDEWIMITRIRNNSGADHWTFINGEYNHSLLSQTPTELTITDFSVGDCRTGKSMDMLIDEFGFWNGRALTGDELIQLYNGGSGMTYIAGNPILVPLLEQVTPINNTNYTTASIDFIVSVNDTNDDGAGTIKNVTFTLDGVVNETNTTEVTNQTYTFSKILSEGTHNWSVLAYNNNSKSNQSEVRQLLVDTTFPNVKITFPLNTTYYFDMFDTLNNYTMFINNTIADTNLHLCWYSNDSGVTNTSITCNSNITSQLTTGNYTYIIWANDTSNNVNESRVSFEIISKITENSRTLNETETYETDIEVINIDLEANSSLTNVWIDYNGTTIPTIQYGTVWNGSKMLYFADVGNNTISWIAQYAGTNYTSNYSYQSVNLANVTICEAATYDESYLNVSFKDEGNDSLITAAIPSSSFVYYLGNGTINKTYLFTNATENFNYSFCFAPPNRTVYMDYIMQYSGSLYPQRIYNPEVTSFSNTTTLKTLYLLSTSDGLYVTFQVVDGADTPINDVFVNATREISGVTTVVGEGLTGTDGGVTYWLNPNFQHTVKFTKDGYSDYTIVIYPTQSIYTVELSGGTATSLDYTRGIDISITPTNASLANNTIYNFSAILGSTHWTVTEWGFNIKNGSGNYYYNGTSSANGGIIQTNINTTDNSSFIMDFYYKANSTYTNYTYYWTVYNLLGDDWSIRVFGDDLKTYLGQGMFGLTSFGLSLILFFIIMIGTGIISYKFGFTSPAAITAAIFGIVFILDIGLGLMDNLNPIGAINHTPTIFTGLVLVIFIIRGVMSSR